MHEDWFAGYKMAKTAISIRLYPKTSLYNALIYRNNYSKAEVLLGLETDWTHLEHHGVTDLDPFERSGQNFKDR